MRTETSLKVVCSQYDHLPYSMRKEKEMAWFGGVRSFHSTCLKSYAHSLASLPDVSLEKVIATVDTS